MHSNPSSKKLNSSADKIVVRVPLATVMVFGLAGLLLTVGFLVSGISFWSFVFGGGLGLSAIAAAIYCVTVRVEVHEHNVRIKTFLQDKLIPASDVIDGVESARLPFGVEKESVVDALTRLRHARETNPDTRIISVIRVLNPWTRVELSTRTG